MVSFNVIEQLGDKFVSVITQVGELTLQSSVESSWTLKESIQHWGFYCDMSCFCVSKTSNAACQVTEKPENAVLCSEYFPLTENILIVTKY